MPLIVFLYNSGMPQWSLTFEVRKRQFTPQPWLQSVMMPQWSLTFEVRKSLRPSNASSMATAPQWSLTFEVRKRGVISQGLLMSLEAAMEPDL